MEENKNLNPVEQEPEQQVEAPIEEMWNAPVAEQAEEIVEPVAETVEQPVEQAEQPVAEPTEPVEQPVAEPVEPVEQPAVLTASNTNVGSAPSAPVYVAPSAIIAKNTTDHGYAVTSLILGIIGLVTCCCYGVTAVVLGVIGLILGILSRKHGNNEGISLAGIIISAISLGLGLIFGAIVVVAFFVAMEDMMYENYDLFEEMYDGYIKLFRPF